MRYSRRVATLALLVVGLAGPGAGQDEGLDPILFVPSGEGQLQDVQSTSFQIYRIPLAYQVRGVEDGSWGLRITFPISLSSHRVEAVSDIDEFVADLEAASIIPGVEVMVPLGERWQLKPFAEVGVGIGSSGGDTEVLYGAGLRAVGEYRSGRSDLRLGGVAAYKQPSTSRSEYDGYSKLEVGLDAQLPLGFELGGRRVKGGGYGIVRQFFELELERVGQQPIELQHQYELGLSFSTDPELRLWKLRLPWIALGYQFGDVARGVRLYFSFPF